MKRKITVIFVTRLNGSKMYLNPELIQMVESTPDTVITLTSTKKFIVKDRPQEIAERFIEYRRRTLAPFIEDNANESSFTGKQKTRYQE
jgi:flagellar protein FlbD